MRDRPNVWWGVNALVVVSIVLLALVVWILGTTTGYSEINEEFKNLFDERGNPRIIVPEGNEITIDPRGVVWYKGKRAEDLDDKELLEVVMLLMEIVRK